MSMQRASCIAKLAAAIMGLRLEHPVRVAIDGVDGAGKTMLAEELAEALRKAGKQVIRASVDGFHHPRELRYRRGRDSAEGYFLDSFDHDALMQQLLQPLGPGGNRAFRTAIFDHHSDRVLDIPPQTARDDAVLLCDGVFLQRRELDAMWDLTIWVEAPFDVTVKRAIARDSHQALESAMIRNLYERRNVPAQQLYLTQCQPRERADIVFNNADFDRPEVEVR